MTDHDTRSSLTRRETLGAAGAAAGGLWLGGPLLANLASPDLALAACAVLTPEAEEGPFYVGLEKVRTHIRTGKAGIPMHLRIRVINTTTCKPIHNAAVDIWQADALGRYSDESREGTLGETWLRGVQLTSAKGYVDFHTIYPGHYQGRTTHIHLKVHIGGKTAGTTYSGGHVSHTGQLFTPDALNAKVYKLSPYSKTTTAITTHAKDRVYTTEHGRKTVLTVQRLGTSLARSGVLATITVGVNPKSTPSAL